MGAAQIADAARIGRAAKNRLAGHVYPPMYRLRARIPRYSLHADAQQFFSRARHLGLGDLELYAWYHTVELGQGLVTPGIHDYRRSLHAFGFPADMRGMRVLDVGSATGFFAFEFERRGAHVTSVEVPSIDALDRFPFEDPRDTVSQLAEMARGQTAYTDEQHQQVFSEAAIEDVYHHVIDGPFRFCHELIGSQVERRYTTIYDLASADLGPDFDLVFAGDILLHLLHPLEALAALTAVCSGTLVVSQAMPARLGSRPAALYVAGATRGHGNSWWMPNLPCFEQVLKKLGFSEVEVVGHNSGVTRPGGVFYDRPVIHARS